MRLLLAVDLGLKTGLALYGEDGRLIWYRSQNFGSTERLRRGAHGILNGVPGVAALVIEGGGNLAVVWEKEAEQRGIAVRRVGAEVWRQAFLLPREQRSGSDAKRHAGEMARRIIDWSGASRPTSLRHDAAEAILVGIWGVLELGWIGSLPREIQRIMSPAR
ncbi:hypothetical protein [Geomonas sp.]|uniref:hypothetical protein n=1 Tax=Geomonas sp. TaxID=2651584 RepID=UPI002B48EF59|nr:hypothetical protein [Geomonas sp.]HJV34913.1 hypothetical protein [Geomonas sp.]